MKKAELKEYVGRLSDEEVSFLYSRFNQRLSGDLSEALELISKTNEIDRWLASAVSSAEFYGLVDQLAEYIEKEKKRREDLVRA